MVNADGVNQWQAAAALSLKVRAGAIPGRLRRAERGALVVHVNPHTASYTSQQ
jgi:hypothetical protein